MGKFLRLSQGVPRSFDESSSITIYDASITVGGGGLTSGTPVTLPSSQTYSSEELEVFLNGIRLDNVEDYNYVGGSPPRTQITFTFDIEAGEIIRFRIDRS